MTDVETSQRPAGVAVSRPAAVWILLAGIIGEVAAFVLTVEKVRQLQNPSYVPSCSINPVLSCGSIMVTKQASLFGFPNPLIGIVSFTLVIVTGVLAWSKVRIPQWYWVGLLIGTTLGAVFVHWLIFQSLYEIGKLCPWCMVVWSVTIPTFLFVTVRNLHAFGLVERSRAVGFVARNHGLVLMVWVLTIVALIVIRFWDEYFSTLY